MLDATLRFLRCPVCGSTLVDAPGAVACERGHAFDRARQGYLSLLAGSSGAGTGDSAAMVAARERFLRGGHFDPIARALAALAGRELAGRDAPVVVDLGAGTGFYLSGVLDAVAASIGFAVDISKAALRRAARAHPRMAAIAADIWAPLPIRDGVAALVLNVFAPRNGPEMHRILAPDGALIVATPGRRHLVELVDTFGLIGVDERKGERLERSLGADFQPIEALELEFAMSLSPADVEAAIAMGPTARHPERLARVASSLGPAGPVPVTAAVRVALLRPISR